MRLYGGRDPRGLDATQTQALNHPLRLRILEMHQRMRSQPLALETLMAVLSETAEYKDVTGAEVKYHQARLRDAKLISAG
jgi:hypothetical protein